MKSGIPLCLLVVLLLHSPRPSFSSEDGNLSNGKPEYLEDLPHKETEVKYNTDEETEEEEENKDPLLVTLPDFGQLRGYEDVSTNGKKFYAFTGIPYALPPIGDLRFKNPAYIPKWEGERNATTMPEACPQFKVLEFLSKPKAPFFGQEDCLYLNVYTPKTNVRKFNLPVIVYLHGGRYVSGSASDFLPHKIMNEDVVLIVVQFRLGVLGFLSTEDEVMPGNLGLKDQTMSFRWITRYIEHFGGDSLTTTLVGSSSGAAMVHFHSLTHHNLGLFSKVILQSGSALCPWAMGGAHKAAAHYLGENLCKKEKVEETKSEEDATLKKSEDDETSEAEVKEEVIVEDARSSNETSQEETMMSSEELMECLQKLDVRTLTMAAKEFFAWTVFPVIFGPYVDGNFLVASPEWLLQQKRHKRMDMIVGINKNEGGLIANALYANEGRKQSLQNMFSNIGPVSLEFTDDDIAPLNMTIKAFDRYNKGLNLDPQNADNMAKLFGDRHYAVCSDTTALIHAKNNDYRKKKVYYYELHHKGQKSTSDLFNHTLGKNWVSHGDENFLLFPSKADSEEQQFINEEDEKVSELMIKLWINFAATGNPTPDDSLGFKWNAFNATSKDHLVIKTQPEMEADTRNETRQFWNNLPTKQNLLLFKKNFPDLVEQNEDDWDDDWETLEKELEKLAEEEESVEEETSEVKEGEKSEKKEKIEL